ncbi:hypothetical protein KMZ93_05160 [Bradyrhizobium sediminis]|uniref:Uncharacterized protein n=1 Tax=Bradyrhizobium sediminis TaxID=2840469 RepID=A0A975P0T3_9BRAD|nr:hypothetical protein [Bradyrhizobium sediminis]QWG24311.1 hypothetical protein KMZ93_05160 [Bradyrhizobium sediminis]
MFSEKPKTRLDREIARAALICPSGRATKSRWSDAQVNTRNINRNCRRSPRGKFSTSLFLVVAAALGGLVNTTGAILSAIIIGPLLYLLVASTAQSPKSLPDYYYAERTLKPTDFIDTTFMYGVQVAALSLFVAWGYLYGTRSLLVPVFWGLGYLVFSAALFVPAVRKALLSSGFGTLHSFLGRTHGSRLISILAASITLLALAGPAMFEPYFTAGAIANGLGLKDAQLENIQMLCFLGFVLISATYLVIGGFRTVVITNKWQLAVGYTAFNALVGLLLLLLQEPSAKDRSGYALLFLLAALTLLALSVIVQAVQRRIDVFSILSHLISTAWLLYVVTRHFDGIASFEDLQVLLSGQFRKSFEWYALLSLLIANGFYQFVDVGQWQRILSLQVDESADEYGRIWTVALTNAAAGLASSVSWCVAIFFGLMIQNAFPAEDPYAVLSTLLNRLSPFNDPLVAFLFMTALLAIMFSTLDALCSSVSFTVQYDWFGGKNMFFARVITVAILGFYILWYLVLRLATNDKLDTVLYASWSLQVGLLPAVVAALFAKRALLGSLGSLIGGTAGAMFLIVAGRPDDVFELAPLLALSGAAAGFVLGALIDWIWWRARATEARAEQATNG